MATYRIPEGELSLAHAAKTSGEHFAVRQENSSNGPGTLMSLVLLLSVKHTITHHNTAHIHSNWAAECFESSKHISIKARETRQSMSFRNYFIQSLQLKFINTSAYSQALTAMISSLRGSMTRSFLSLQAVQMRLPLRFQQTLKMMSGCMSSRVIMASPVPTFQTITTLSQPADKPTRKLTR